MVKCLEELRALPEYVAIQAGDEGFVVLGKVKTKQFIEFCFSYWDAYTQIKRLEKDSRYSSLERISYKTFITIRCQIDESKLATGAFTG